jgi:hypothetical protein
MTDPESKTGAGHAEAAVRGPAFRPVDWAAWSSVAAMLLASVFFALR